RVHRCRHAVQAPEQDDLTVEVVGLDHAGATREALPGRPAAPRPAADLADPEPVAPPLAVLLAGRVRDAGRFVAGDGLADGGTDEPAAPGRCAGRRFHR